MKAAMTTAPEPKPVLPEDLVSLEDCAEKHPLRIDLVYAKPAHRHNIFKAAIYRPEARMWGHREFVPVILRAAGICHAETKLLFELKDCLRTVEAQEKIVNTPLVKAHPEWLEEPRLFAPPGKGGHPRGMAVDVILIDANGDEIEMGTPFDYMTENKNDNPAARDYTDFGQGAAFDKMVLKNRKVLENAMMQAAKDLGKELLPLPQEWWDFRFPHAYTNAFAPVFDSALPADMRLLNR